MTRPFDLDQETLSASEDYYHLSGFSQYCNPLEVDLWSQSVSTGECSLPTPPESLSESLSECSLLDYPEMSPSSWTDVSLPNTRATVHKDNRTMSTSVGGEWSSSGMPITTQGLEGLNSAWLEVPQGHVVSGSSPVLSHESQSSYTLTTASEPDSFMLPSGMDFHYADPNWSQPGPFVLNSPDMVPQTSGYGFAPVYGQSGFAGTCPDSASSTVYPGSQPSMAFQGQASQPRRTVSYPVPMPMRPLLPRTESTATARSHPAYGQGHTLGSHVQGHPVSRGILSNVSTISGQMEGVSSHTTNSPWAAAHLDGTSNQEPVASHTHPYAVPASMSGQAAMVSYVTPGHPVPFVPGPMSEETNHGYPAFYGAKASIGPDSYTRNGDVQLSIPSNASEEVVSGLSQQPGRVKSSSPKGSATVERNPRKTHWLYAAGKPDKTDGLYHCPWEHKDTACTHKPTRLKCNYDKYVDSHLKPFTCKYEECENAQFSSTACLLRHEREAHARHGHGNKPFLCLYGGCDRSEPGNGFPRKYNFYDHMRRMHGHEVQNTGKRSAQGSRAKQSGVQKKKKAVSTRSSVSVTGRRRAAPAPSPLQQTQVMQPQVYTGQPVSVPESPQVQIPSSWMSYPAWPNPSG